MNEERMFISEARKIIKKTKKFVRAHYYSFLLAIGSLVYGIQLMRFSHILATFSIYQNIIELIDYRFVGTIFIILSAVKLIGLIFNIQRLRRYSLVAFTYVYSFFSLSLLFSEPQNTVWIFALIMAFLAYGISDRGDFTG